MIKTSLMAATVSSTTDVYCQCIEHRNGGQCQLVPGVSPVSVMYTFPTCGGKNNVIVQ